MQQSRRPRVHVRVPRRPDRCRPSAFESRPFRLPRPVRLLTSVGGVLCALVSIALGTEDGDRAPRSELQALSAEVRATLAPDLADRVGRAGEDEFLPVILSVGPPLDLEALEREMADRGIESRWRRHRLVVERAQAHALRSQAELLTQIAREAELDGIREVRPYWVTNAIAFRARPGAILRLASARPTDRGAEGRVSRIHFDSPVFLKTGERTGSAGWALESDRGEEPGPNLVAIRAPEVWERGITGLGRLVAQFDAGAEGDHSSFADRWRGARADVPSSEAWFDPYTGSEFPFDSDQGHGTGTLSLMVGIEPDRPPLGVAFAAEWISAGVVIGYDVSKILSAFEWAIDPDGDPSTIDDVPDVINHSWGTRDDCSSEYWDAIDLCEAAGIVNIIAVDNSGPNPGSVNSPESRASSAFENFSVGAVDTNQPEFPIRSNSGRGPSPCDGVSIKPEITAPGTAVRTALPRNTYGIAWSGTSFAAPHVSGVAALLRQLDPSLSVREVKTALLASAIDLGLPGEDNAYGFGLVDALAAVEYVERHVSPSPPPLSAIGPTGPAPVALLRWAPPRYLGRGAVPAIEGYRVYRTPAGVPFGDDPLIEVGTFPTELWDREAVGPHRYLVTAVYADGSESEPTPPVEIEVIPDLAEDTAGPEGTSDPDETTGPLDTDPGVEFPQELVVRPNPFRGSTDVTFQLSAPGRVRLDIWDSGGRRVRRLVDHELPAGRHSRTWKGRDDRGLELPSGVYFVRLIGAGEERVLRLRVAHLR